MPVSGHAQQPDPLNKMVEYCSVREASTSLMVAGRDNGIKKDQVVARLGPIGPDASDAERATVSRLNDVYGMPRLSEKTISAHRMFSCWRQAMLNKEPHFGPGLEDSLLECQLSKGGSDEFLPCVKAAQRMHSE